MFIAVNAVNIRKNMHICSSCISCNYIDEFMYSIRDTVLCSNVYFFRVNGYNCVLRSSWMEKEEDIGDRMNEEFWRGWLQMLYENRRWRKADVREGSSLQCKFSEFCYDYNEIMFLHVYI